MQTLRLETKVNFDKILNDHKRNKMTELLKIFTKYRKTNILWTQKQ